MKPNKAVLSCLLILLSTGLTTLHLAAGGGRFSEAVVRSVNGRVSYQVADGEFMHLKVNMALTAGVLLKSESNSEALLQVNGLAATVEMAESTTLVLPKMEAKGLGDTDTELKLESGTIRGRVRMLSANSDFKVNVPQGAAYPLGSEFSLTVRAEPNGGQGVTFTSITGDLKCEATPTTGSHIGQVVTNTLHAGQSWTPGADCQGSVVQLPQAALDKLKNR